MYNILGYKEIKGAQLPDGEYLPWYYRGEYHPENAIGFRDVWIPISKEEYDKNI